MIVVDVEASGVDPYKNSLVSVGAFEFEHPENTFYAECRIWQGAHIEDPALAVNGFSREQIQDGGKKSDKEIVEDFLRWVETCADHTLAGQNPSFDRDFLMATAHRYHLNWPLPHRTIDLHSIAYFHYLRKGLLPPASHKHSDLNLDKILQYVGIPSEPKPHNALTGAKLETEAFYRLIYEKGLFDEFKQFTISFL
jgi:DNA polymerase-3 subunit epsilon